MAEIQIGPDGKVTFKNMSPKLASQLTLLILIHNELVDIKAILKGKRRLGK